MIRTACSQLGCSGFTVPKGRGRCARHRQTEAQRGYGAEWKRIRRDVRGAFCKACGSPYDLTVDHVVPQSKGGTHDRRNLRTLCRSCHGRLGDRRGRTTGA